MGPKSTVFIPLYIYPAPGAWTPLENVIRDHPDVSFTVVINPGSGPGPSPLPDANYTREIPKLTANPNVRVLGYVATTYATKNHQAMVLKDVEAYANWPKESTNPGLAVRGIFFDEIPQHYSAIAAKYLQELTASVKKLPGLGPDNFVVHNPGTVPDPRYLVSADSTVIFEDTYETFQERNRARMFSDIANSNRSQLCCVIHSVPDHVAGRKFRGLVKDARKVADEIFITHLTERYYESFDGRWGEFVDLVAS